ncbi:solute carrier family 22 member 3 isoform X2 [Chrysemys picta bellii]|uniref:solute carrier family 22 member 3 isoform X2 n=1 Tax=Chrysemys picta bellii TaxID=8478 RepID=UPI0032B2114C
MPSFDEVLKEAGEFGRFQKRVFFLLCQTGITFSFLFVGVVFLGHTPEYYWCRIPGAAELSERCGWTLEEEQNYTVPALNLVNRFSGGQCERFDIEWNNTSVSCANPLSRFTNSSLGNVPITSCQDGWVYKQPHSTIVSEIWQNPYLPLLLPWGRVMWPRCGICTKFFHIFGLSFPTRCIWKGNLDDSICYCDRNSWLRSAKDCWNCDTDVLHPWNNDSSWDCLPDSHVAGDSAGHNTPQFSFPAVLLITVTDEEVSNPSFLDLVRTPHMRKYTLILMYAWFTSALVYQGLVMRLGIIGGNLYLTFFISGAVELPAALLILLTIDRIGRRLPFAISNVVAGVACLITAFLPEDIPWLKTSVATLGRLGITMAFEIVYLVNSELYPTTLRNFGVSLCSSLCDLGGIIAPFLLFRLAAIWMELPLIIFSILAVICGILVLFLPETKGISLPETVEDVEQLSSLQSKSGRKKKHQDTAYI